MSYDKKSERDEQKKHNTKVTSEAANTNKYSHNHKKEKSLRKKSHSPYIS